MTPYEQHIREVAGRNGWTVTEDVIVAPGTGRPPKQVPALRLEGKFTGWERRHSLLGDETVHQVERVRVVKHQTDGAFAKAFNARAGT